MSLKSSIKYGVFNGKIGFTAAILPSDSLTVTGVDLPPVRTMADLEEPVFPNEDGMNVHREGLLMYRIATAIAATMGRDGRYIARDLMFESDRAERDLAAVYDTLRFGENQVLGRGVRFEDV